MPCQYILIFKFILYVFGQSSVIPSGENEEEGWIQLRDNIERFYPGIVHETACEDDASNQRALEMIVKICRGRGAETFPYIEGLKSAKAAWDQLFTMYEHPKGNKSIYLSIYI